MNALDCIWRKCLDNRQGANALDSHEVADSLWTWIPHLKRPRMVPLLAPLSRRRIAVSVAVSKPERMSRQTSCLPQGLFLDLQDSRRAAHPVYPAIDVGAWLTCRGPLDWTCDGIVAELVGHEPGWPPNFNFAHHASFRWCIARSRHCRSGLSR